MHTYSKTVTVEEKGGETGEVPVGDRNERSEVIEFTPELTARREQQNEKNRTNGAGASDDAESTSEFETQIELARVFIELGDKDGARKILSEVITDGGSDFRRVAEELMSAINV